MRHRPASRPPWVVVRGASALISAVEMMGRYSNLPDQPRIPDLGRPDSDPSDSVARRSRKSPKLSAADLRGIRADYEAGMTVKEICSKYSVTRNTVRVRARGMGLSPRGPRGSQRQ